MEERGKKTVEWTGRVEIRKKILAVGEACKAIFRAIPGFKGRAFGSFRFSTEETLISASAVPHCRGRVWKEL